MYLALLLVLTSFTAFGESLDIYLVNGDKEQGINPTLIGVSKETTLNGAMADMNLFGLCLEEALCTRTYGLEESFNNTYARSNGYFEVPKDFKISTGGNWPVTVENKVSREGDLIKVNSTQNLMGNITTKDYEVSRLGLKIDFASENPGPRRFDYDEASPELQNLSPGVFQIMLNLEDDGLGMNTTSSGTGFFISEDGHAMTNLHVAEGLTECMLNKNCSIKIKFKDSESRTVETSAEILTCSKKLDFCLLKFGSDIEVKKHFNIRTDHIPEKILTLGFPGDKNKTFPGNEDDETCLTYATGSPVGLMGFGVTSSLYIAGGASGSPVIDELGNDVLGILSNGLTSFGQPDGAPGLFRPMALIDANFEISDYLDGSKQKRIDEIVSKLNDTTDPLAADELLKAYVSERSYYGINKLEEASFSHPSETVRRKIFYFLKKMSVDI